MPTRTETIVADQEAYNAILSTLKVLRHASLELFANEGITDAQLQALELLVTNGPMLMRKISDALMVTPANVTGIVDRLEEKKLVQRTSGKGDRRATIVEITPEGKVLYERVGRKKGEMIQKSLATFTREEKATLNRLLEKFRKRNVTVYRARLTGLGWVNCMIVTPIIISVLEKISHNSEFS